jgi:hypothetical protein
MIKIAHKKEAEALENLPKEVAKVVTEIATILDDNYHAERDIAKDLGGYILIAETNSKLGQLVLAKGSDPWEKM